MNHSKAWLTAIGYEEMAIVREHGWDSPGAVAKREEFKAAYQAVKHIRKCYNQEAHGN